jgi:hypothetical protein
MPILAENNDADLTNKNQFGAHPASMSRVGRNRRSRFRRMSPRADAFGGCGFSDSACESCYCFSEAIFVRLLERRTH